MTPVLYYVHLRIRHFCFIISFFFSVLVFKKWTGSKTVAIGWQLHELACPWRLVWPPPHPVESSLLAPGHPLEPCLHSDNPCILLACPTPSWSFWISLPGEQYRWIPQRDWRLPNSPMLWRSVQVVRGSIFTHFLTLKSCFKQSAYPLTS